METTVPFLLLNKEDVREPVWPFQVPSPSGLASSALSQKATGTKEQGPAVTEGAQSLLPDTLGREAVPSWGRDEWSRERSRPPTWRRPPSQGQRKEWCFRGC